MIKKFINYLFKIIGFKIVKNIKDYSFDHVYKNFFSKIPVIIDVGSNEGQSVLRFLRISPKAKIHCFEPITKIYKKLKNNFKKSNLIINNLALGDKVEDKLINVYNFTVNSSFNKPIKNSFWQKKKIKLNKDNLIKNKEIVNVITLDSYVKKKKLNFIDLLKIDTQGFEEKILKGSKGTLKKNIIKFIEVECIIGNQYQNRINLIDIEKHLIKNNFRLYGINQKGDLLKKPDLCIDLLYANHSYVEVK